MFDKSITLGSLTFNQLLYCHHIHNEYMIRKMFTRNVSWYQQEEGNTTYNKIDNPELKDLIARHKQGKVLMYVEEV